MSVLTSTPLKTAPSAATGVTLATGNSWVYGAWVEVIAATAAPIAIAGIQLSGGTFSSVMWELDVGVGAASAETSIGTLRLFLHNNATFINPFGVLLPVPLGGIGSGVRVAVRSRTSVGSGPARLSFLYYESFDSAQVTTSSQVLSCAPSGSATANLAPSATPWANSPWVEVIASGATDIGLLGLTHYTASTLAAADGIEYDIGIGAASGETVITTLRQGLITQWFTISWLPGIYPLPAGTRVSVRMRKAGTTTSAHPVALIYYTNVSVSAAAVETVQSFICGPL